MTIGASYALWINSGNTLTSGNITMNGTSANLLLSGASSTLTLSNTAASTSSITGALRCAGGAYFGSNCLFNAPITANSCLFNQSNVTIGGIAVTNSIFTTGSDRFYGWRQPNAETISILSYSAGGTYNDYITWAHNAGNPTCSMSASIIIPITTASTSSTTGAIRCAGGAYFGNDCLIATTNADSSALVLNNSSTSVTARTTLLFKCNSREWEIGARNTSNVILSDTFYLWDATIGVARMIVNNTGGFMMNPLNATANGVLHIRGSDTYMNGAHQVVQHWNSNHATNPINVQLQINPNTNATSTNTAYFGTTTNNDLQIQTSNTGRLVVTAGGFIGIGTGSPGYLLDVSGGNVRFTGRLMLGTSTDTSRMMSILDGVTTDGSVRTITLGSTNSGGNQAELTYVHRGSNNDYNRLSLGFHSNATILNVANNGFVGIGTVEPIYPLHITNTKTANITNYGYINDQGQTGRLNSPGNSGDVAFSALFGARIIVAGEVEILSDRRKKRNIIDLDLDMCNSFIKNAQPSSFEYINTSEGTKSYGYIAQDIAKNGFHDLITLVPDETLLETIDDDGFVSPDKHSFILATQNIIPILHKSLKDAMDRIEKLEKIIEMNNLEM